VEAWLTFLTALVWQVLVAGALIALYRAGLLQKLSELHLTPTGLILKVQEIREKQAVLQRDVDALRFLVSGFVTKWELTHLEKLAGDQPFEYRWGGNRDDRFIQELIRLWDFGLITRQNTKSWYDIPHLGNLRDYAVITPRGREYLHLRLQLYAEGKGARPSAEPVAAPDPAT
jgi:hypothetical protein